MRKILSCEFNPDTACVELRTGWTGRLRGERGGERHVSAMLS